MESEKLLKRIRIWLYIFIAGLVISGLTAFPLVTELSLLSQILNIESAPSPDSALKYWIYKVNLGLQETHDKYPFIAYGTDWLGFAHIVIAIFFIGPIMDPVKNIWVTQAGMIACVAVIPCALIAGAIREIPIYWRIIDCSFGVFGIMPLIIVYFYTKKLRDLPVP